jgi:hypothetical protein
MKEERGEPEPRGEEGEEKGDFDLWLGPGWWWRRRRREKEGGFRRFEDGNWLEVSDGPVLLCWCST